MKFFGVTEDAGQTGGVPFCGRKHKKIAMDAKTLDVFRLQDGLWVVSGLYVEDDKVRAEPFPEVEIDLTDLWLADRLRKPSARPIDERLGS